MRPSPEQIPIEQLEDGRIYLIRSRNLLVGVWRASSRGFIGIREKFGERYLFEEFHYDNGPPLGTAWALRASGIVTKVPERYWDHAKGHELRNLLMPLHFDAQERFAEERRIAFEEAESLKYRPQTLAENRREQAIAAVRQWRKDLIAEAPEGEKRVQVARETHKEYAQRMETAIKENPVD